MHTGITLGEVLGTLWGVRVETGKLNAMYTACSLYYLLGPL